MALQLQQLIDQALTAMQSGSYEDALRLWNRARNQMDLPVLRIQAAICQLRLGHADLTLAVLGPLLPKGNSGHPNSEAGPSDQRILFTLDPQDPAMILAWAIACQGWQRLQQQEAAQYCLQQGLQLWEKQHFRLEHSTQRTQKASAVQELMTAAGCLGEHVTVFRLYRQISSPNTCMQMLAAIALFNHGMYQEAAHLWQQLEAEAACPLLATAEWLQAGLVPPFALEYDFPWHHWAEQANDDSSDEKYSPLVKYPLTGHVRLQLLYRCLCSTLPAHENWESLTILLRETSPWSKQFALQALNNPWFESHLRPRILQLLLDKGILTPTSEILWWHNGRTLRTTPEKLHCLDSTQSHDLINQALDLLLQGRENEALPLLERAYRWRPGDELIGLAMAECLSLLGQWHRARSLLIALGRYWYDDIEFHRDAALVASCLQDYDLHRHHMYSLRALHQGQPPLPPL